MTWVMTIAAGVALGYFLVQFITKNTRAGQSTEASGDTETVRSEEEGTPARRLHRSSSDRKIAGVCGGIAEYLHADPSVVRLVTVVLMLGWGSGLLAYIICALVLPEE